MLSTISFNYAGADISAKILQAVNSVTIRAVTSVTQVTVAPSDVVHIYQSGVASVT